MAHATAGRLLRQGAEGRGVAPGEGPLPLDRAHLREKAQRDRRRLERILDYATSRECRASFIYDYFAGTAADETPSCGACDVCLGWREVQGRPLSDPEVLQVRIALSGVARLSGRFGQARIAQVLVGSRAKELQRWGLHHLPTYGKLSALSQAQVQELLAVLLEAGLVERVSPHGARPGTFVLAITQAGRRVMNAEERPELPLPREALPARAAAPARPRSSGSKPPGIASLNRDPVDEDAVDPEAAADLELLGRLKSWRTEEARRRRVPAYVVFADRTLEALAAARPASEAGLLAVKGIGPAKLETYGEALLRLLSGAEGESAAS